MIKYNSTNDLDTSDQQVIQAAQDNTALAYAPYSKFHVGAAVLLDDGTVVGGAKQENASYPLSMCGKRVCLYCASVLHPGKVIRVLAIAVSSDRPAREPVPPCGACRQVISEYQDRQAQVIRILLLSGSGAVTEYSGINELLPDPFGPGFLLD